MHRFMAVALAMCGLTTVLAQAQGPGWVTLFDGTNLNNFNRVGNANWTLANGIVEATSGPGFLVTKENYTDLDRTISGIRPGRNAWTVSTDSPTSASVSSRAMVAASAAVSPAAVQGGLDGHPVDRRGCRTGSDRR